MKKRRDKVLIFFEDFNDSMGSIRITALFQTRQSFPIDLVFGKKPKWYLPLFSERGYCRWGAANLRRKRRSKDSTGFDVGESK